MAYERMYGTTVYVDEIGEWPNPLVRTRSIYYPTFDELDTVKLDPLTAALLKPHDLYTARKADWVDWYNWYAGTFIGSYLHRHIRERLEAYKSRQSRVYYWNYVEEIVDLYASFIFSKGINRTFFKDSQDLAEQEMFEKNEFWTNCDLKGTRIDAFMRKIFNFTQIFNFVDVVVDMPRTAEQLLSEQERLDSGIRPYVFYILPFNAVNWERDREGNLLWYRWRERVNRQYNPFQLSDEDEIWNYTTWTRYDWSVHQIIFRKGQIPKAVLLDQGFHILGKVPVVRFAGKKDLLEEDCGLSVVSSLGKINVAVMNYLSLIDEDVYSKVLNLLLIENPNSGDDDLDPAEGGSSSKGGLEIGTNNALEWSGTHPPSYLSPAAEPGEFILKLVGKCIDEMYKLATLWTDSGIRESRSGVSYCLARGTLIDMPRDLEKYPDGVPIELLAESGKSFYVYSRLNGAPTVCRAKRAWQSGKHVPVYRVSFEWWAYGHRYEGSIVATASHRFMLRDGSYKRLRHLNLGDSLMPFSRSRKGKEYAGIIGPGMGYQEYEHRFIARRLFAKDLDSTMAVHHRNGNKLDNRVSNLEVMTRSAHASHHFEDEEFVARVSAGGRKRRTEDNGRWITLTKPDILEALEEANWRPTVAAAALGVCFITLKRKMALHGIAIPNNHRITAIEFAGYEDVFDIEVPVAHNFVANGIVVHNSYEFNRTNNKLADKAQLMEEGEIEVHKLYSRWLNEPWTGDIQYPDSFDVETLMQELDDILQVKKAVRSPTLIRELEKRIASKLLLHSTTQVMQEVISEIDTLPSLEEQTAARMAETEDSEDDSDDTQDDSEEQQGE